MELEELRREQSGYEQQIQAVDEAMKAIQEQIDSMTCTVSQNKVSVILKTSIAWMYSMTTTLNIWVVNTTILFLCLFHQPYLLAVQEAVRKAQEELAKQKEVIMAQDKELRVRFS